MSVLPSMLEMTAQVYHLDYFFVLCAKGCKGGLVHLDLRPCNEIIGGPGMLNCSLTKKTFSQ